MSNNNPQTQHWQDLSSAHHLAPFSDYTQLKNKGPRIITKADGVYLWDSEGHKICFSRPPTRLRWNWPRPLPTWRRRA
jgi:hypothetical protein